MDEEIVGSAMGHTPGRARAGGHDAMTSIKGNSLRNSLIGLIGLAAALAEILNFFGVKASHLLPSDPAIAQRRPPDGPASAKAQGPSTGELPEKATATATATASKTPVRLVLVVENSGNAQQVARAGHALRAFAASLTDGDSVSLISFVDGEHSWLFKDAPGVRARGELKVRSENLFPSSVGKARRRAALEDASRHLDGGTRSGVGNAAVVVFSATADDPALLVRWDQALRSPGAPAYCCLAVDGDAAEVARR